MPAGAPLWRGSWGQGGAPVLETLAQLLGLLEEPKKKHQDSARTKDARQGGPFAPGGCCPGEQAVYSRGRPERGVATAELFEESRSRVVRTLVEGWCGEDADVDAMTEDLARAYGEILSRQLASRAKQLGEIAARLGAPPDRRARRRSAGGRLSLLNGDWDPVAASTFR